MAHLQPTGSRIPDAWSIKLKFSLTITFYLTNTENSTSLVICASQLAIGLLLKKLKYFEVMLNIFKFSRVWENVESWLVSANKLFWIAQPYFSTNIIKRNQCFFLLLRLLMKKIKFLITCYCFAVTISPYFNETKKN